MGTAMEGYQPLVIDPTSGAEVAEGTAGVLAMDVDRSPLFWFRGYWKDYDRSTKCYTQSPDGKKQIYVTGDIAARTGNSFYYKSRGDDIITSRGYRVGPFEVESALMKHSAV